MALPVIGSYTQKGHGFKHLIIMWYQINSINDGWMQRTHQTTSYLIGYIYIEVQTLESLSDVKDKYLS